MTNVNELNELEEIRAGMTLPERMTCADCKHFHRCSWLISCHQARTECDWYPSRFVKQQEAQ